MTMNKTYRALALLLDYPSAELTANLAAVSAALAQAPMPSVRNLQATVRPLLEALAKGDLIDLQEAYVDTFDRGRRSSLNLFEHVHGDSRDRGQAMVDLLQMYRQAGLEMDTDQLPDYLPAFLEYLSLLPQPQALEQLGEVTHIVRTIGTTLGARGSAYASAFDALLTLAGEAALAQQPADAEACEDDTTLAAIDAAWKDQPVNFLDAPSPCATPRRPALQTIQIHRRTV